MPVQSGDTLADTILQSAYTVYRTFIQLVEFLLAIEPSEILASLRSYYDGLEVAEDTRNAVIIGMCCGIGFLSFLVFFPGEPWDYSKLDGGKGEVGKGGKKKKDKKKEKTKNLIIAEIDKLASEKRKSNNNDNNTNNNKKQEEPALDINWDVDRIKSKTKKLQKVSVGKRREANRSLLVASLRSSWVAQRRSVDQ